MHERTWRHKGRQEGMPVALSGKEPPSPRWTPESPEGLRAGCWRDQKVWCKRPREPHGSPVGSVDLLIPLEWPWEQGAVAASPLPGYRIQELLMNWQFHKRNHPRRGNITSMQSRAHKSGKHVLKPFL